MADFIVDVGEDGSGESDLSSVKKKKGTGFTERTKEIAEECEFVNGNRSPSQSSTVEASSPVMVENSLSAVMLDSSSLDLSLGGSGIDGGVTPVNHMYYLEARNEGG
uniref:Uncharacterized protein LOC104212196 n=1 Tax=Nicotiana sylvestris TaxID=4096 RepID=A0A1U7VBN8_NICSY|nr:PREDICTED: uncharacterized protein LOC104212196 [Nicotiana sylvestris]